MADMRKVLEGRMTGLRMRPHLIGDEGPMSGSSGPLSWEMHHATSDSGYQERRMPPVDHGLATIGWRGLHVDAVSGTWCLTSR